MQVLKEFMTNKMKAILIELVGELPQDEEGYLYGDGYEPQAHLPTYNNLFEECRKNEKEKCEATCMMVRHCDAVNIVMQQPAAGFGKFMVLESFIELVDINQIDEENGEYAPLLPISLSTSMAWFNNVMVLKVPKTPMKYDADKKILLMAGDMSHDPNDLIRD